MVELDYEWEKMVKELYKVDRIKAYEETQKVLCNQICNREDCERDCAFVHRVIRHLVVGVKE